jgi:aspartate kinase
MRVCKFGGSSLAFADGFRRAAQIMLDLPERKIMVVSAPGKHSGQGDKITDVLFGIAQKNALHRNFSKEKDRLASRLHDIEMDLLHSSSISDSLLSEFEKRLNSGKPYLVSIGEEFSCNVMVEYLKMRGVSTGVFDPVYLPVELNGRGIPHVPASAYPTIKEMLSEMLKECAVVCAPGFFGTDAQGKIQLFARGGSDYTAVVLAVVMGAECCEKFTDVDGVMDINPKVSSDAQVIPFLSHDDFLEIVRNTRSSIFQLDALKLAKEKKLTIRIANLFNPNADGTIVQSETSK